MAEISDEYVAGFFDGEGCVAVHTHSGIRPYVQIGQGSLEVLERIHAHVGLGSIVSGISGGKPYWWFQITAAESIVTFLERLMPYLIVKRRQAVLGLELAKGIRRSNNQRLTVEEQDRRRTLAQDIYTLNGRGTLLRT